MRSNRDAFRIIFVLNQAEEFHNMLKRTKERDTPGGSSSRQKAIELSRTPEILKTELIYTYELWYGTSCYVEPLDYCSHILALMLCNCQLCFTWLSCAVSSKNSSTIWSTPSDGVHLEHTGSKGVSNGNKQHSMVG